MTNPPSYQEQLENAKKYQNATEAELPHTWSGKDRFVRADFWVRNLPQPRNNDANTAYGFMYSVLEHRFSIQNRCPNLGFREFSKAEISLAEYQKN